MHKGNLKISKHLFLQQNNVTSAAHYLKRTAESLPFSRLRVYMCLVNYFCCSSRFSFSCDRHMLAVFWYPPDRRTCVIGSCMYLYKMINNKNKACLREISFPQGINPVHSVVLHSKFCPFAEQNCYWNTIFRILNFSNLCRCCTAWENPRLVCVLELAKENGCSPANFK